MKHSFPEIVEKGRLTGHPMFRTQRGDRFGAFTLRYKGKQLNAIVGSAEEAVLAGLPGWDHVSVNAGNRCPSWEEMCWIKSLFFDPEECVVQYHPPEGDYVNNHPFVLHMWRHPSVPMPPKEFV